MAAPNSDDFTTIPHIKCNQIWHTGPIRNLPFYQFLCSRVQLNFTENRENGFKTHKLAVSSLLKYLTLRVLEAPSLIA